MILFCKICGKRRFKPLFFLEEGDDAYPICHTHVDDMLNEKGAANTLGPWEAQLSGDTWIVKVRR